MENRMTNHKSAPIFSPKSSQTILWLRNCNTGYPQHEGKQGCEQLFVRPLTTTNKGEATQRLRLDGWMDERNGTKFSLVGRRWGVDIIHLKNEYVLACATTWMNPEGITKHEIKLQKDKYDMIFFWEVHRNQKNQNWSSDCQSPGRRIWEVIAW